MRLFKIIATKHTEGAFYRALAANSLLVASSVMVSAVSLLFVQASSNLAITVITIFIELL